MALNFLNYKRFLSSRLLLSTATLLIIGVGSLVLAHTHKTDQSVCLTGNEKVCGYAGTINNSPLSTEAKAGTLVSGSTDSNTSVPQTSKPSVTKTAPVDNTAQCNNILNTGKAALTSLNVQINQQLAIMKQIIANEGTGLPAQINGGGVNGLIGNAQIQESFNQANNQVNTLTNQIDPTRQNYVNQLQGLQCWTQALTMLNFNPSTQQ